MGALTETEIFDCMYENLQLAAEHARDLALQPAQGPIYRKFREEMLLAEGACRQAGAWREDTRWGNVSLLLADARERTGKWLRGYTVKGRMGKTFYPRDLYMALAVNLEGIAAAVESLRHGATHQLGMILPEIPNITRTEGRAVQVMLPQASRVSPGGIILAS